MARARLIKPSFFTNTDLSALSALTRLLFISLWCLADREGRLEDNPQRIKAQGLPYDKANVGRMLADLEERGFIVRYESAGGRFIQIVKFLKHQTPHIREAASTIPAPCLAQGEHESSLAVPIALTLNPIPVAVAEAARGGGAHAHEADAVPLEDGADRPAWLPTYEQAFGPIPPAIFEEVSEYSRLVPSEWFVAAFEEAREKGGRSWAYVKRILDRCTAQGRPPGGAAKAAEEDDRYFRGKYGEILKQRLEAGR